PVLPRRGVGRYRIGLELPLPLDDRLDEPAAVLGRLLQRDKARRVPPQAGVDPRDQGLQLLAALGDVREELFVVGTPERRHRLVEILARDLALGQRGALR